MGKDFFKKEKKVLPIETCKSFGRSCFSRPPAISGSHTLQYPRNKQQEMLAAQHQQQQQQNMRQLGTHTLGRLPSHNHSPSHHGGGGKHGRLTVFFLIKIMML